MYFYDISMIVLIPGILLGIFAQSRVSSTYKQYSKIGSHSGLTGAQFARKMLDDNGLYDVSIVQISGQLSDHYDPRAKQVRLSGDIYGGSSIASLGIAAHEVGHAIQHSVGYFPLNVRNAVIPVTNFSSTLYFPIILLGLFINSYSLVEIGIILFAFIVFFQLVTLPVEYNASNRAIATLQSDGVLNSDELIGAKRVLGAAALTYVAAMVTALLQLLQLVLVFGRRD
jgi:Zn-dependent membrane protease YugP